MRRFLDEEFPARDATVQKPSVPRMRALCDELGEPEEFLGVDEDVSDDGGDSPPAVGHPADDTTVFLSSAEEGRVELFDFDGDGDELEPTSPPRGASEPAG